MFYFLGKKYFEIKFLRCRFWSFGLLSGASLLVVFTWFWLNKKIRESVFFLWTREVIYNTKVSPHGYVVFAKLNECLPIFVMFLLYLSFSKSPRLMKQWGYIIKLINGTEVNSNSKVCSLHFESRNIERQFDRTSLKTLSIPTLNMENPKQLIWFLFIVKSFFFFNLFVCFSSNSLKRKLHICQTTIGAQRKKIALADCAVHDNADTCWYWWCRCWRYLPLSIIPLQKYIV